MSRIGIKVGDLTIIAEAHNTVRCRCKCGAEDWYPSDITKPTYRHRRMCARCAGRPCEICGTWINAQAGRQSPTCSIACRKKRASQREAVRYQKVKSTESWREVRQAYIARLKARMTDEPGFAAIYRAFSRQHQRNHVQRINSDPIKRSSMLESKREIAAAWRAELRLNPEAYLAHLQAARNWYAALSQADKDRIYNQPRKRK
jgi:hypothetical protein